MSKTWPLKSERTFTQSKYHRDLKEISFIYLPLRPHCNSEIIRGGHGRYPVTPETGLNVVVVYWFKEVLFSLFGDLSQESERYI